MLATWSIAPMSLPTSACCYGNVNRIKHLIGTNRASEGLVFSKQFRYYQLVIRRFVDQKYTACRPRNSQYKITVVKILTWIWFLGKVSVGLSLAKMLTSRTSVHQFISTCALEVERSANVQLLWWHQADILNWPCFYFNLWVNGVVIVKTQEKDEV